MSDSTKTARNVRLAVLFTVLVLMLIGLWYDRKVARPSVEEAWSSIAALNDKINAEAKAEAMTNSDVQRALNRQPSRTMTQGDFQIEVYSWMAGLPFRTRDYYAVYSPGGGKLFFTTHFKYAIPEGELIPPPTEPDQTWAAADTAPETPTEEEPTEGPRRKGRPRRVEEGEAAAAETPAEEMEATEPKPEAAETSAPPVEPSTSSEANEGNKPEGASDASGENPPSEASPPKAQSDASEQGGGESAPAAADAA